MIMTDKYQLIWTLDDYQRFLRHPDPIARGWAVDRIEQQYPRQAAESFVGLLTDPDSHLQIMAARAIGESGDLRYEPALLAALPKSDGAVRNWLMTTLSQLHSPTRLPKLVAELEAAPAQCPPEEQDMPVLRSIVEALGYYPDEAARSALWRFFERYLDDDRITYTAFKGLLNFVGPDTILRLVQRYRQLNPRDDADWQHAVIALAQVVGLDRLTQELIRAMPEGPDEVLWQLDDWLQQDISYSESFEDAFYEAAEESYANVLPHILTGLEQVAAERGDDLPAWLEEWRAGEQPGGYRWRMLYAHQVIAALAEHPPSGEKQYQEMAALSLALWGQALTDQNDEAMLQAAPDEPARQKDLLDILGSIRQNVMPGVLGQVAALGPDVVPDLIHILEDDHFWALPRALEALVRIARVYPGAADAAIPAILDLIDEDESDYVLEPAGEALVAIGPSIIEPAAARLGQDFTYDIYVCYALGEIPTHASAEALLNYIGEKQLLEEYEAESLADLGHPDAIPFLREYYEPGDPLLGTVLYKLALLNDYTGPEMVEWWGVAFSYYADFIRAATGKKPTWLPSPGPAPTVKDQKQAPSEKKRKKRKRRRR
jgi:HEAT repeat protein